MTFKKLLIILTFAVTAVIIMLLSTSYAWYQFDNAVTTFNNVETFENLDDFAVVFTNDSNINTNVGIPVLASEVEKRASKTTFTLTPSESLSGKEVAFQISLVDLNIDSALANSTYFKWSLLETVGDGTAVTVANGNFKNIKENTLVLKQMTKVENLGVTYSYEFRLWLEDSGNTQNGFMGKSVTGRIKISTAVR